MMFIYKIMEVKIFVSLREHHNNTFADNDVAAYTSCLGPNRKFIIIKGPPTRQVPYSNHSVLLSVSPSVRPSVRQKTLTLAITYMYLLSEIGLSYLACVFLMTRPFRQ